MSDQHLTRSSVLRLAGLAAASFGVGGWKSQEADGGGPAAVESGALDQLDPVAIGAPANIGSRLIGNCPLAAI